MAENNFSNTEPTPEDIARDTQYLESITRGAPAQTPADYVQKGLEYVGEAASEAYGAAKSTLDEMLFNPMEYETAPEGSGFSDEEWRDVRHIIAANPSGWENLAATMKGTARGTGEGLTFLGGAQTAIRAGAPVVQGLPPVPRTVGNAALFIGGGITASMGLADFWEEAIPAPTGPTRSYFEAGRTAGAGFGFTPQAFLMRKLPENATRVERMVNLMAQTAEEAKKNKQLGRYFAAEGLSNAWIGFWGGTTVDQLGPDSPWTRFGVELGASVLNPARTMYDAIGAVQSAAEKGLRGIGEGGEEVVFSARTVKQLQEKIIPIIEANGENPDALGKALVAEIQRLLADDLPVGTTAMVSDSPTLLRIERAVASAYKDVGNQQQTAAEASFIALRAFSRSLLNSGDENLVKQAVSLLEDSYRKQFNAMHIAAEAEAVRAAQSLGKSGSVEREAYGELLQEKVGKFLEIARKGESELWEQVFRQTRRARAEGFDAPLDIRSNRLLGAVLDEVEKMSGQSARDFNRTKNELFGLFFSESGRKGAAAQKKNVDAALDTYANNKGNPEFVDTGRMPSSVLDQIDMNRLPVEELMRQRGEFLAAARKYAAEPGGENLSRVYGRLANAVLKDIEDLDFPAYKEASTYSRELNDHFTRAFPGQLDDIAPGVTIRRMSGHADPTYQKHREIIDAANKYEVPGVASAQSVLEAQQRVVRAMASEASYRNVTYPGQKLLTAEEAALREADVEGINVQPKTTQGLIDPRLFREFTRKNADLIKLVGLEDEFSTYEKASAAIAALNAPNSLVNRSIRTQKILAEVLENESPSVALAQLWASKNPAKDFKKLYETVKAHPRSEEALQGLKEAIYQRAFTVAEQANSSNAYFHALDDMLFGKLTPNGSSVMELMARNGMVTKAELDVLKNKVLLPAKRAEQALERGDQVPLKYLHAGPGQIMSRLDDLLVTHFVGKYLSGPLKPGGPASLSWAGQLMAAGKYFTNQLPAGQRRLLLQEIIMYPDKMAAFLDGTYKTAAQKEGLFRSAWNKLTGYVGKRLTGNVSDKGAVFETLMQNTILQDDQDPDVPQLYNNPALPQPPDEAPRAPAQTSRMMLRQFAAPQTRGLAMAPAAAAPQQAAAAPAQGPAPTGQGGSREMLQRLFPMDTMLG